MDIRQLRYFLAIAKEEQITRAAKALHMEQPPLSRQLKLIEQELGTPLFDRSGKQMKLTQAGDILKRRAEHLIQEFNDTIMEMKELEDELQGKLAVGSVVSCISLLPNKIRLFRESYPRVSFKIIEGDHFTLAEHLENRAIELAITRLPFESHYEMTRYEVTRLPSDPFVIVLPREWNLPFQQSIPMKEIVNLPLLALKTDKTSKLHDKIVNECRSFGFEPNFICECSSVAIIVALVVAGIGASILPKSVMSSFPIAEIQMLDIPDTSFQSDTGVVWLKNRYLSKSARTFINIVKTPD
ncbi:MAG: LysR family transcriptional regulator [Bacilli bacterium]|nr:LysR family transcriptional regulator [Bacilli bacterium]